MLPFCAGVRPVTVSKFEVAPLRMLNVVPPSVLTSHWSVGAGVPLAAARKVAELPAVTVWLVGWIVKTGELLTVRAAGLLMALPDALLKTASYSLPLSAAVGVKVRVAAVAPGM